MNILMDLIGELYPRFSYRKLRYEGNGAIAIVANRNLEIVFLNAIGCRFIQLADGSRKVTDIMKTMLDEYDVEATVLGNDLLQLIRDMQWKHLMFLHKSSTLP